MEKEKYNFFKTPDELIRQANEGLIGNQGSSMVVNFVFWLVKLCFFAGLTLLIITIFNLNTRGFNLILFASISAGFLFLSLLCYGPLRVSVCKNSLNMIYNTNPSAKDVWFGFKNRYFRNVWFGLCTFFAYIFTFILLIFPFVKKYISNQLVGYILAEDQEISAVKAMKLASKTSKGFKKTYVKIFFKMFPKMLLCLPTVYIYSLFLRPKFNATVCSYYFDIKSE